MDPIGSHEVDKPNDDVRQNVDENPTIDEKNDSSVVVVCVDVTEAFTTDKVSIYIFLRQLHCQVLF
jgi:hypothetical protein